MSSQDQISAYLRELKAHLRARGLRRRRIVEEVQTHLLQSAHDLRNRGIANSEQATQAAIDRFGDAKEMAAQFNFRPAKRRMLERRLVVLWTSWIAAMAMGSATVWAAMSSPEAGAFRSGSVIQSAKPHAAPRCMVCAPTANRRCDRPYAGRIVNPSSPRPVSESARRQRQAPCQ